MARVTEFYVGETMRVRLLDLKDQDGDFITALGGGDSIAYAIRRNGANDSTGSLTYVSGTDGDWRALPEAPTTPGDITIRVTATIDTVVDIFEWPVKVKALQ